MMKNQNVMRRQWQDWSNDDVRILKQLFRNASNSEVAAVLERSPKAVERKAAKLGLFKTKKYLKSLGR